MCNFLKLDLETAISDVVLGDSVADTLDKNQPEPYISSFQRLEIVQQSNSKLDDTLSSIYDFILP